ncbi:DUF2306 domain-containing protein [Virgibacillus profundi]|uniref:DUF2306 domain-containing protein n=1 Tax=Virgibacillus profundi TaxID=2024555 RepID=A0A2A2ID00_9BACI|nr:DUF2306 domain-containing protein [Virgibacillus profundi]PAV29144.1 DUF2306 domain-containing protein [Virgibacillus profundi]PXY53313.1 DUF2306 domain-containing protein [Virgibacillus profundi]
MNTHIFLLIIHIIAGSFCLLTGAINFSVKKEKGYHTRIGEWYHIGYLVVFITSVGMAIINWSESAYLFYIAIFSYGLALFGYLARKLRWRGWLSMHISGMAGSYIGIITAILVVNGAAIPLINQIPSLLLWSMPTIIGTPIIFMVGRRV